MKMIKSGDRSRNHLKINFLRSKHYCKVVEVCPSSNIPAGKGVAIKLYETKWNGIFGWYYAPEALNMEMLTLTFEEFRAEGTVCIDLPDTIAFTRIKANFN